MLDLTYQYDKVGNLEESDETSPNEEGVNENVRTKITWTVTKKVAQVEKTISTDKKVIIQYRYDEGDNRIAKTVETIDITTQTTTTKETRYIRDIAGNILSTYVNTQIQEFHRYAATRLGTYHIQYQEQKPQNQAQQIVLGLRTYELANHLGNVLVVISDKKLADDEAHVVSATDYYPFGMTIESRSFSSQTYRFGFNGQEKDTEIHAEIYHAEFWQYDSRVARRWNTDPITFANISTYATFRNNPIYFNDPNGAVPQGGGKGDKPEEEEMSIQRLEEIIVEATRTLWDRIAAWFNELVSFSNANYTGDVYGGGMGYGSSQAESNYWSTTIETHKAVARATPDGVATTVKYGFVAGTVVAPPLRLAKPVGAALSSLSILGADVGYNIYAHGTGFWRYVDYADPVLNYTAVTVGFSPVLTSSVLRANFDVSPHRGGLYSRLGPTTDKKEAKEFTRQLDINLIFGYMGARGAS